MKGYANGDSSASGLVSVLIPAYNAERWITETITSALNQTWPQKEIIVVDDGSRDKTLQIARQFESKSVKVLTQENMGAAGARNKALSFAQGDYVQWLDADDLLSPQKISEQMKIAETGRTSLTLLSSPHGVFYWRWEKARFKPNSLWQDLSPVDYLVRYLSDNAWLNPAGWLVSRRLIDKVGPWDERLSLNDDGEYFCRVVAASQQIKFVRNATCYYRRSGFNQLSNSATQKACNSMFLSLSLSIDYLRTLEDSERTRRASLMALQGCLPYFYPEQAELLKRINALASELGGELVVPRVGWKSAFLAGVLGWKRGNEVKATLRKLQLAMAVKWDKMMYRSGM